MDEAGPQEACLAVLLKNEWRRKFSAAVKVFSRQSYLCAEADCSALFTALTKASAEAGVCT